MHRHDRQHLSLHLPMNQPALRHSIQIHTGTLQRAVGIVAGSWGSCHVGRDLSV
ncbi:hypothetical protein HETIRDRAFT_437396, partial [Heterobasidion irregulare TC 32-1]